MNYGKITEFFEDTNGDFSMQRLVFFLWMTGILIVWVYGCIEAKKMIEIDKTVVAAMGVLVTGKVVSGIGESSAAKTDNIVK